MVSLIFPKDISEAKQLAAQVKLGKLNRIRQGIYTDANPDQISALVTSRWYEIVEHLCDQPVAAYRTAVELKPHRGRVFVVANVQKRRRLAVTSELIIDVLPGNSKLLTEPFVPALLRSALPRQLMENLTSSRSRAEAIKSLGRSWVEQTLSKFYLMRGEIVLNEIRDQARTAAKALGLAAEFIQLDKMISALLTTRPIENHLTTRLAIATAKGEPFDAQRLQRFELLADYLNQCSFEPVPYIYNAASWRNMAFFESYFSNFIEGTEFLIEEAEEIVFSRHLIESRHADSHDIMAVFDLVSDYQEMSITSDSADAFIKLLQKNHQLMMVQRPDKHPGVFKAKPNQAGDSIFVLPDYLIGTLTQGFKLYQTVSPGLARAIFIQFLVSECHPFDDGNGRLSRIMLNAELHAAEQHKLIVPTVHRESYLNGLRQATREGKFRTLVKVFFQLQRYTAALEWSDYGEVRKQLESHKAHRLPDEGLAEFNRHIRHYQMDFPVS